MDGVEEMMDGLVFCGGRFCSRGVMTDVFLKILTSRRDRSDIRKREVLVVL